MMFMLVQVLIINLQMHLFYILFTLKSSLVRLLFYFLQVNSRMLLTDSFATARCAR